jgi:outer membrane protein OmpA-like peptidoglycan-associated protein
MTDGRSEQRPVKARLDTVRTRGDYLRPDSVDALLRTLRPPDDTSDMPWAHASQGGIPLVRGLRLTSANHFPDGDRENVVTVSETSSEGVTYAWDYREQRAGAAPVVAAYGRFVRAADLAAAPRLNQVFSSGQRTETPGYTAMELSRATYRHLLETGEVPYTITDLDGSGAGPGLVSEIATARIALRGSLVRVSGAPEAMTVLVDGHPTMLPVLHLRGTFAFQEKKVAGDFWVLADSAHPLILRESGDAGDGEWQMIRIDRPAESAGSTVEDELEHNCRAELPGIYFAFASADLEPESGSALTGVAALLARHPDWSLAIEGHTDSIGGVASNQALSERRAEAVRSALVTQHRVTPSRLTATGFGATRPRESNATLEGRARNRRVELVRRCAGGAP